ncbi:hypothetical protein GW17_00060601 [Ensete ventricosum]|nr:hypothetical protein GW17_00060601 [Ensete ventricosum]
MARPSVGVAGTTWPPARGRPAVAQAPYKGATECGQPVGAIAVGGHDRLQQDTSRSGHPASRHLCRGDGDDAVRAREEG